MVLDVFMYMHAPSILLVLYACPLTSPLLLQVVRLTEEPYAAAKGVKSPLTEEKIMEWLVDNKVLSIALQGEGGREGGKVGGEGGREGGREEKWEGREGGREGGRKYGRELMDILIVVFCIRKLNVAGSWGWEIEVVSIPFCSTHPQGICTRPSTVRS